MKVFAVFMQGVYRHKCLGIFSDLQVAKDLALHMLVTQEGDCYHAYDVTEYTLDVAAENIRYDAGSIVASFFADYAYEGERHTSRKVGYYVWDNTQESPEKNFYKATEAQQQEWDCEYKLFTSR